MDCVNHYTERITSKHTQSDKKDNTYIFSLSIMYLNRAVVAASIGFASSTVAQVPVIPDTTSQASGTVLTHTGPFDASTRANPTLSFFEKFVNSLEAFSFKDSFPDFYAPNCTFYNGDGTKVVGGANIAAALEASFAPFNKIVINQHVHRVIPFTVTKASGDEGANNPQDAINANACASSGCNWIFTEHDIVYSLSPPLNGPTIPVRRSLTFLAGPAQVKGQGTNGLQWYELKIWSDQSVLDKEIAKRQG